MIKIQCTHTIIIESLELEKDRILRCSFLDLGPITLKKILNGEEVKQYSEDELSSVVLKLVD